MTTQREHPAWDPDAAAKRNVRAIAGTGRRPERSPKGSRRTCYGGSAQKRLSRGERFVAQEPTFQPNGDPTAYDFANVFRNVFFR